MKELIIKTQQEWDSIQPDFKGTIYIEGGTCFDPIIIKTKFDYADVITRGTAFIEMRESSQVNEMWESSKVNVMRESSQVNVMRESSQVNVMRESSQVNEMRGSSKVNEMWESSQVNEMCGSSKVNEMCGSSQVNEMGGESMVSAYGLQKLICHGNNVIRTYKSNEPNLTIILNDSSHLIILPDKEPTFDWYQKNYPVQIKDGLATLYKAVRKIEEKFLSDYNRDFEYPSAGKLEHPCDPSIEESCSHGLHVSHLSWALNFSSGWADRAILECQVPIDKIIVAKDCDGKVRTSELIVVRELDKSEYENL